MTKATNAIPSGMHTLTPHIAIKNAAEAIEFYKKAFGAQEIRRMKFEDGKIMHASLKIGDSVLFLADECPEKGWSKSPLALGGTPVSLHLYVENVDESYSRAIKAGATEKMPVTDMFWGDRYGQLTDPYGHVWSIATHKEDLTEEEQMKRYEGFCKQMAAAAK
jgi:PhnB protein